jgi:DNA-damage-inducible protein J
MKSSSINVRIDQQLKINAEEILEQIGLTASDAVRILYKQVCLHHGLPFELKLPSDETLEAIIELESGKGSTHADFKSLMSSI